MWRWLFVLAGCGRIGFGTTDLQGDATALIDAAPVPAVVCSVTRHPNPGVPADADLAFAPISEGFVIAWVPTNGGQIAARKLDTQLGALAAGAVPAGLISRRFGGIADAGENLVAVTGLDTGHRVFSVSHDLTTWMTRAEDTVAVVGHDPFPTEESRITRVFLDRTAVDKELRMSIVQSDGTFGIAGLFPTANPITAIAGDDGPNHGHAVWIEKVSAGVSRCTASDIVYSVPPQMGSMQQISDDCHDIRNASGPPAADSMIIVWTTAAGSIEARYIAQSGDLPRTISAKGRSPKVKFDGTQFWIAWIDDADSLHLTTFDLTGIVTDYPMPGWRAAGDEAFELSRRGEVVYLALLDDPLTVMTLCAP